MPMVLFEGVPESATSANASVVVKMLHGVCAVHGEANAAAWTVEKWRLFPHIELLDRAHGPAPRLSVGVIAGGLSPRRATPSCAGMFIVDEKTADAIRAWDEGGEFAAVAELRRYFAALTGIADARRCVRAIVGWVQRGAVEKAFRF